jgi:alkylation response protein AidB-like acyl-CoA dehydrogenase
MIDFRLTEEQEQIRQLAHKFAEREIRPVAPEYDEREETPWPVLEKAAEIGLTSYQYPEEFGGGGMESVLTACLVTEESAWGCLGIGSAILGCGLAAVPILVCGSEEQKRRYLPWFTSREKLRIVRLTEPEAGSDAAALRTRAIRDGDFYVLNGQKRFITHGGIADLYVVFATLDPSLGHAGITAFIVEASTPGVAAGKKEKKMGMRASHTGDVILQDVRVPEQNRIGGEGQGFAVAMKSFEHTRPLVAASAVGVARPHEHASSIPADDPVWQADHRQAGHPVLLADMATERCGLAHLARPRFADQGCRATCGEHGQGLRRRHGDAGPPTPFRCSADTATCDYPVRSDATPRSCRSSMGYEPDPAR